MDTAENFNYQDRQIICMSLFRAVEWIRSLLSAFSTPSALSYTENYRMILRMNQLIEVENDLFSHCQRYPSFLKLIAPDIKIGTYNALTGKRITKDRVQKEKVKSDKGKRGSKEQSHEVREVLIMEDIISAVEQFLKWFLPSTSIYFCRPLAPHTSCILGYGLHPFTSSLSQSGVNDKMERLHKEAILRLLNHTVKRYLPCRFVNSCCSFDSMLASEKISHHDSSSYSNIVSYIGQLLESGVFLSLNTLLIKSFYYLHH